MNDEGTPTIKLSYDREPTFDADKFSPKSYPNTEMLKRSFKDLIELHSASAVMMCQVNALSSGNHELK